jgi:hypothetical protein
VADAPDQGVVSVASGYLTDLADVARSAGLKVVEVDGWRTRGHGRFVAVDTIVCHHTAGPKLGNMPSLGVVTRGRADLAGPLCNYGLARDGTVYVVAAGYAWHAGQVRQHTYGNAYAIGIEAEGTGRDSWPSVQMDAYARLCAALCAHYGVPVGRVLGHKEVCAPVGRKSDPNFDMGAFRARVVADEGGGDMPLNTADLAAIRKVVAEEIAKQNHARWIVRKVTAALTPKKAS